LIELHEVKKSFEGRDVLDGINFHVPEGGSLAIMGPSGSGKSVMLKHIIGLLKPDSGQVTVMGRSVPDLSRNDLRELRRDMGYLFQNGALINWLNVFDNVALPLRETTGYDEKEISARVRRCLDSMALPDSDGKFPSEISGGMQKRVSLARTLVTEPRIILYDEPEAGLDPGTSVVVSKIIRRLQEEQNVTTLVVTHNTGCARLVADRLALFSGGRIVLNGSPDEVIGSDHPDAREFFGEEND